MRARAAALVTIVLAALVVSAGMADDASARKRSFRPAATERGMLVFRLHGVRPRTVRSAALRVGRRTRRLPARRVRRAAGRGLLRVRAGKTARAGVRGPRLFVWTRATSNRHLRVDADALHVSPAGDDRNPGTAAAPWSTLTHAAEEAGPGATVVVHAGTYSAPGRIVRFARDGASDAPITFAGAAGEAPPRLLGQLRIDGDHVRVHNFLVDGPTGPVAERSSDNPDGEEVPVWIRGSWTELAGSEVRNGRWHAGIYVSDQPSRVRLVGNHVHHNGNFGDGRHANVDHGIYWDSGSGLIAGNVIADNVAYGVHLYPSAAGVVVRDNRITGNGKGGVIVSEESHHNVIAHNVVARNRQGIRSYALTGHGNVARSNILIDNWDGDFGETGGLLLRGNLSR